jgi:hypothetical protein
MLVVVVHSFTRYLFENSCFEFVCAVFPLRRGCYACYCVVIKNVQVVLSVSLCMLLCL